MCHFSRPGILHMNDAISYILSGLQNNVLKISRKLPGFDIK